ncbi:hypothetical protein [Acidimangrovimonas pyrenivorans]|uniref:Uncharacterized protein n=1 Tax=Acidimangrovimonas pyrenivorans TaxID=2030798 RepID=A0ABV7AD74_9RHOB
MTADLLVTAHYADDADTMFERASSFADLVEMTRGISTYKGLPALPMVAGRTYKTDIKVLGLFRCDGYEIKIQNIDREGRRLQSSESNEKIKSWRHSVEVRPCENGSIWTDRIVIDAGVLTPLVARYAQFMYRYRHRHRKATSIQSVLKRSCRTLDAKLPMFFPAD